MVDCVAGRIDKVERQGDDDKYSALKFDILKLANPQRVQASVPYTATVEVPLV